MKKLLSLVLTFSFLLLGGCDNTPPADEKPTDTTASITATVPSSTQTTLKTTTTADVTTTTAPSGTTTTTTAPSGPTTLTTDSPTTTTIPTIIPPSNLPTEELKWTEGEPLLLENATAKYTVNYPTIISGAVAYHNGLFLFDNWTLDTAEMALYDPKTATFTSLGGYPLPLFGSGVGTLSADGRYYYFAQISIGDADNLSVYRVDMVEKSLDLIEKKLRGQRMFFLYAEGDWVWRFWTEDPNNTGNAEMYTQHLDRFNTKTGEVIELFSTETHDYNHVCIADKTLYALSFHSKENRYSLDTFTLEGSPLESYDLSFLNSALGERIELTQINVGGDFVILTSTYAGQKIVLEKADEEYRLIQTLSDNGETRITGYRANPSRSGFGYMFRSDSSLIRYDEESRSFVEHAIPKNHYYLVTNEFGHLVVAFNNRAEQKGELYLFDNITW